MTLKGSTVTVIATSADGFSSEYEVRVSSPLAIAIGATGVAGVGAAVFAIKKKKNVIVIKKNLNVIMNYKKK